MLKTAILAAAAIVAIVGPAAAKLNPNALQPNALQPNALQPNGTHVKGLSFGCVDGLTVIGIELPR